LAPGETELQLVVQIMDRMLDTDGDSKTRAGLIFISAGFIYVQLLLNVAANSVSAGCDLTALFPRYINIRRGGYIAAVVGICMNPWLLYKSSATFSNYLGAYGVLLSCIVGPMITDYWLVRRGHYRINDLYSTDTESWYWYTFGINWRAYVAYLCGFAMNAPGFINTLNPSISVAVGAQRIYALSWVTGTGVSALIYYILCTISPPPGKHRHFKEIDMSLGELRIDEITKLRHSGAGSPQEYEEKKYADDSDVHVMES